MLIQPKLAGGMDAVDAATVETFQVVSVALGECEQAC